MQEQKEAEISMKREKQLLEELGATYSTCGDFTLSEVHGVIHRLKNNKSLGNLFISVELLKGHEGEFFYESITFLLN